MLVLPQRRLFTAEEYYRMAEVGILRDDDPVELIEGEIVEMAAMGNRHIFTLMRLTHVFVRGVGDQALVSVQMSLRLSRDSVPEPDLVLLRPRPDYRERGPHAEDALLLVEVSDTTLTYDRGTKVPLYAHAGIPEVWIVDVEGEAVEVYRRPGAGRYQDVERVGRGGRVSPGAFPELSVSVDEIL
jgi:Uma2 family endonuclease